MSSSVVLSVERELRGVEFTSEVRERNSTRVRPRTFRVVTSAATGTDGREPCGGAAVADCGEGPDWAVRYVGPAGALVWKKGRR